MLRFYIISCLLIVFGMRALAQNGMNDSLLIYEKQYYDCKNDTLKQSLLLKKIDLYIRYNAVNKATYNECERVKMNMLEPNNQKLVFLWNSALIAYLNGADERCRERLQTYFEHTRQETTELLLMQILANRNYDTTIMGQKIRQLAIRDTIFKSLRCLIDLAVYERKHINFYLFSSAIVPGSGTAMNGEPLKGLLSVAITAASVYGIVKLVHSALYINTVLLGAGMGLKFYTGNMRLTQKAFDRKEMKQKNKLAKKSELVLSRVLAKYPLGWKN